MCSLFSSNNPQGFTAHRTALRASWFPPLEATIFLSFLSFFLLSWSPSLFSCLFVLSFLFVFDFFLQLPASSLLWVCPLPLFLFLHLRFCFCGLLNLWDVGGHTSLSVVAGWASEQHLNRDSCVFTKFYLLKRKRGLSFMKLKFSLPKSKIHVAFSKVLSLVS